jgi:RNA polymerase sigma factor (sigma-70 family)
MRRIVIDYFPRLRALSRRVLGHLPGARTEAEDVVQSALKSLCRYMRVSRPNSPKDREDIWRLLCHITACKARRRVTRRTRGARRVSVSPFVDFEHEHRHPIGDLLAVTAITASELDEAAEHALEQLDPPLRKIALLTIEGRTQAEIAARLGCSRRTIIRKVELIRAMLTQQLLAD